MDVDNKPIFSITERYTIPIYANYVSFCWSFETTAISSHASFAAQFVLCCIAVQRMLFIFRDRKGKFSTSSVSMVTIVKFA